MQGRIAKIARREAVLVATESFQVIGQRLWHAGRAADGTKAAFASIEPLGSAGKNDLLVHQRHSLQSFFSSYFLISSPTKSIFVSFKPEMLSGS